jgi:hypothetical protein
MVPSTNDLIDRLIAAPEKLNRSRLAYLEAEFSRRQVESQLKDREAQLLACADSPIDGKNAEQRAAQLRRHTEGVRGALLAEEQNADRLKARFQAELDEFTALRAISALLGRQTE